MQCNAMRNAVAGVCRILLKPRYLSELINMGSIVRLGFWQEDERGRGAGQWNERQGEGSLRE